MLDKQIKNLLIGFLALGLLFASTAYILGHIPPPTHTNEPKYIIALVFVVSFSVVYKIIKALINKKQGGQ